MENLVMLYYPLCGVKVKYLECTDIFKEIMRQVYLRGLIRFSKGMAEKEMY
jgi:hypothetical protein